MNRLVWEGILLAAVSLLPSLASAGTQWDPHANDHCAPGSTDEACRAFLEQACGGKEQGEECQGLVSIQSWSGEDQPVLESTCRFAPAAESKWVPHHYLPTNVRMCIPGRVSGMEQPAKQAEGRAPTILYVILIPIVFSFIIFKEKIDATVKALFSPFFALFRRPRKGTLSTLDQAVEPLRTPGVFSVRLASGLPLLARFRNEARDLEMVAPGAAQLRKILARALPPGFETDCSFPMDFPYQSRWGRVRITLMLTSGGADALIRTWPPSTAEAEVEELERQALRQLGEASWSGMAATYGALALADPKEPWHRGRQANMLLKTGKTEAAMVVLRGLAALQQAQEREEEAGATLGLVGLLENHVKGDAGGPAAPGTFASVIWDSTEGIFSDARFPERNQSLRSALEKFTNSGKVDREIFESLLQAEMLLVQGAQTGSDPQKPPESAIVFTFQAPGSGSGKEVICFTDVEAWRASRSADMLMAVRPRSLFAMARRLKLGIIVNPGGPDTFGFPFSTAALDPLAEGRSPV